MADGSEYFRPQKIRGGVLRHTADDILNMDRPELLFGDPNTINHKLRRLRQEWHPDRNPDPRANEVFKRITELHSAAKAPNKAWDTATAAATRAADVAAGSRDVDAPISTKPAPAPDATDARPTPAAMGKNFTAMGLGLGGLALAASSLFHSVQDGRYGDAFVDATSAAMSTAPMVQTVLPALTDNSSALSRYAHRAVSGLGSVQAVGGLIVVTGGLQIAAEEEGYRGQRTAAVALTTAAGFAGSAAATSVAAGTATAGGTAVAGGGIAAAAVAAAPVVLVAAGVTGIAIGGDAAITANKANDSLQAAIGERGKGLKFEGGQYDGRLQKYPNLRQFAIIDDRAADGRPFIEDPNTHDYSQDPAALERIEQGIAAKIAHYDKIITENTSWYGTSGAIEGLFGDNEKIDDRRDAQIERARFVAAQEELAAYRAEIERRKLELPKEKPKPDQVQSTPVTINTDAPGIAAIKIIQTELGLEATGEWNTETNNKLAMVVARAQTDARYADAVLQIYGAGANPDPDMIPGGATIEVLKARGKIKLADAMVVLNMGDKTGLNDIFEAPPNSQELIAAARNEQQQIAQAPAPPKPAAGGGIDDGQWAAYFNPAALNGWLGALPGQFHAAVQPPGGNNHELAATNVAKLTTPGLT